ncbi:MAG: hypothetical protein GXO70_09535 [Acidobacteria bacterium]|nr:hypothetical protein [Acidobacteriota bacterium]
MSEEWEGHRNGELTISLFFSKPSTIHGGRAALFPSRTIANDGLHWGCGIHELVADCPPLVKMERER